MKFNIMKENPMENLEGICSRIGLQEEVREKIFQKTYLVIANGKFEEKKRSF